MGDEVTSAVADAGPIIHLNEINSLPLLHVFDALHIPDAVWAETVEHARVSSHAFDQLGIVHRHTLSQAEVIEFTKNRI